MQSKAGSSSKPHPLNEYSRSNHFFLVMLWGALAVSLALAPWHGTWSAALLFGFPAALIPTLLILNAPGSLFTRMCVGAALMVFCGLHIHQAGGMIEVHFGIFALLALLVIYEDWRVIVVAAAVIAVHHVGVTYLQANGYAMMCMPSPSVGLVLIHAGYVVVESAALCYLAVSLRKRTIETVRDQAAIETHLSSMRNVAAQVAIGVDSIQAAALELTASSGSIAGGARLQAASLEETAASLEQITATLRQTAEHAGQATMLATASKEQADEGRRAAANAVSAMGEIDTASAKTSDIISTIDEIAFQTNILAINAAVEAARAGEQGRGFAVLAMEIRGLAQRSAGAAKDIRRLIQDTLGKVERGARLVNQSGETLESLVSSAGRVSEIVGKIAAATEEQSAAIEQINTAVVRIDQVTQSNAAQTATLSATAQSLSGEAGRLVELVADFDLEEEDEPPVFAAAKRPATHAQAVPVS